jgi:hypothetical protein
MPSLAHDAREAVVGHAAAGHGSAPLEVKVLAAVLSMQQKWGVRMMGELLGEAPLLL